MTDLTPLQIARQRRREMAEQGIKIVPLTPIQKLEKNPTNRRLAINAYCWGCVGAGADTNPRKLIRECEIVKCALWAVRPYQLKVDEEAEDES